MRITGGLASLLEQGLVDKVVRPLMSGKEAQVYLVVSEGEERVAKVYKEANDRTFKHRVAYTEGRRVKSSRDQRAMQKRSRHGRAQDEAAWRSAEVDMIYRLRAAGVRVPTPYHFVDGVLVMELVKDADGQPAPRLGDVDMDRAAATAIFDTLIGEVVKMLCAGVVHGDLSDFNVLLGHDGPVIIDFPQAMDASHNQNARPILLRDVANLNRFLAGFGPPGRPLQHAAEMWELYTRGELTADTPLTGRHAGSDKAVDLQGLLEELDEVEREARLLAGRGCFEG